MKLKSTKIKSGPATAIGEHDGYCPSLNLPESAIPELAYKKVGSTCMICCEVKITRISSDNSGTSIGLDVIKAAYMDKEEKDES